MLNVTWERKDLSFNNQGFLSNPSMVLVALDRERLWDRVCNLNLRMFLSRLCVQSYDSEREIVDANYVNQVLRVLKGPVCRI